MEDPCYKEGPIQEKYTVAGNICGYYVEVTHTELKEHKVLSAKEEDILENKIAIQKAKWAEKWEKVSLKRREAEDREANIEEADFRTQEAQDALNDIQAILSHTLNVNDAVDWGKLKNKASFKKTNYKKVPNIKYAKNGKPIDAIYKPSPSKANLPQMPSSRPNLSDPEFTPQISFWDNIFKFKKNKKIKAALEKYKTKVEEYKTASAQHNKAVENWEKLKSSIEKENENLKNTLKALQDRWELEKKAYEIKKAKYNKKIDALKENYFKKKPDSILEHCELVLNNSKYPESFPQSFELEYNPENKILIVEYALPPIEKFPTIKEVKYIATRKEFKESHINKNALNKMFDSAMYQITLRTIHELFEADVIDAIDAISFNGWVESLNTATGKRQNACILSIQVKKDEFLEIDLAHVDPKSCFKNLKGIGSSKLCSITPVKPILQIDRSDKRFINSYAVAHAVDDSTNLAAMNWEDFEHLVRELFEKEFKSSGGEVKVTQSSRDGGVDAIAFDPDPIRGGKIVIQAKRYTSTVGLAAIRDLYGTVVNEGATKGILVTTADYGPDAYSFAKDKPLTLLNGGNLLHLLEKHGHQAKIDLKEAKKNHLPPA